MGIAAGEMKVLLVLLFHICFYNQVSGRPNKYLIKVENTDVAVKGFDSTMEKAGHVPAKGHIQANDAMQHIKESMTHEPTKQNQKNIPTKGNNPPKANQKHVSAIKESTEKEKLEQIT
eukprot:TRINITY_DN10146_c0_g1_i1.p1 TRINITY_DN10146_c0_g1~~TRINITY_DN10146_c0_g1_i1.p1  ORF type:complete len:126 (-),score=36.00 TRINITY_DN10146_c0_g1_i1:144-497(-)